jgi:hypothetical protein
MKLPVLIFYHLHFVNVYFSRRLSMFMYDGMRVSVTFRLCAFAYGCVFLIDCVSGTVTMSVCECVSSRVCLCHSLCMPVCLSVYLCVHVIVSFFSFAVYMWADILVFIRARVYMVYVVLSVSEYVSTNRVCAQIAYC